MPRGSRHLIVVYGTIIDMPATVLNVTWDTVSSMLVARIVEGKTWIKEAVVKKSKSQSENRIGKKIALENK